MRSLPHQSCRSSSARRWTTASAWPSSASTCATTAARRRKLLRDIPLTYPSYEDPDGKVANGLTASWAPPSTIYYDASGKQTYIHQGQYLDRAQLDADIKRYAAS